MYNFFKNVLTGLGTLAGIIAVTLIVLVVGAGLALILGTLGLIGYGLFKILGWLLVIITTTILLLWFIGWVTKASF